MSRYFMSLVPTHQILYRGVFAPTDFEAAKKSQIDFDLPYNNLSESASVNQFGFLNTYVPKLSIYL